MKNNIREVQKEFCANPECPNHQLIMTDERHYHACDKGVVTTKHIIYTLPYCNKKKLFRKLKYTTKIKYFCETCMSAIDIARFND